MKKVISQVKKMVDTDTGEIYNFRIIGLPDEFYNKDKDFIKFFTAFTIQLVIDNDISGKAIRLLFYIVTKLIKSINQLEFYMSPKMVCDDLNISLKTYHLWKNALIKKGIIRKIATNLYILNPQCVCVGNGNLLIQKYLKTG